MTTVRRTAAAPLSPAALLDSFRLSLAAARKSPETVKTYTDGVRFYLAWCDAHPDLDP